MSYDDEIDLTAEEERAIASLKRLAKRWPSTLGLFSWSGSLCIIKLRDGEWPHPPGREQTIDQDYIVETISGIRNDGGDPS